MAGDQETEARPDAQYRATVLVAFRSVADTLRALEYDAIAWRARAYEETGMDRLTFGTELKRDGFEIQINTTEDAKVNPEHSHPFDERAVVIQDALTLTRNGASRTDWPGETFSMPKGCLHYESYGPKSALTLFGRKM
jgi:quercetin dioxygenase-like cupin family protein